MQCNYSPNFLELGETSSIRCANGATNFFSSRAQCDGFIDGRLFIESNNSENFEGPNYQMCAETPVSFLRAGSGVVPLERKTFLTVGLPHRALNRELGVQW